MIELNFSRPDLLPERIDPKTLCVHQGKLFAAAEKTCSLVLEHLPFEQDFTGDFRITSISSHIITNELFRNQAFQQRCPGIREQALAYFREKAQSVHDALFAAAEHNDIGTLSTAILAEDNLETANEYGDTVLIKAAENGHTETVKALLTAGAKLEGENLWGNTAIVVAASNGHTETINALLTEKRIKDTALMYAASNGHTETVKALLTAGAKLEAKNFWGNTAIVAAANNGQTETVKAFLTEKRTKDTALMHAAKNGHLEIVQALILEVLDYHHEISQALFKAAEKGHTEIVQFILKSRAITEETNQNDDILLVHAIRNAHMEQILAFTKDARDGHWETNEAFLKAAENGRTETVQALITGGVKIEAKHPSGNNALIAAASNGHTEIVQVLIKAGAKIEEKNPYGTSALIAATLNGHAETVQALINAKANPEAAGEYGDTALIWAARNGHATTVQILKKAAHHLRQQRLAAGIIALMRANKGSYFYESMLDLAPQIVALTDGTYRSRQYHTYTPAGDKQETIWSTTLFPESFSN